MSPIYNLFVPYSCFSQSETTDCFGSATTGGDDVGIDKRTEKQKDDEKDDFYAEGQKGIGGGQTEKSLRLGGCPGKSAAQVQNEDLIPIGL